MIIATQDSWENSKFMATKPPTRSSMIHHVPPFSQLNAISSAEVAGVWTAGVKGGVTGAPLAPGLG